MTVFNNYMQMLGLNIMLILMASGFLHLSWVIYFITIVISIVVSIWAVAIFNSVKDGTLPSIVELQFIPDTYPMLVFQINVYSTVIHAVLAYTLLNSIALPLLMLVALWCKKIVSNKFREAICHQ